MIKKESIEKKNKTKNTYNYSLPPPLVRRVFNILCHFGKLGIKKEMTPVPRFSQ
jgi:hypothetical protein